MEAEYHIDVPGGITTLTILVGESCLEATATLSFACLDIAPTQTDGRPRNIYVCLNEFSKGGL
jgi:hypothetical protein